MSATCQVYQRMVNAPIAISLTVEMTAGGLIDAIDGATWDDETEDNDLRVMRAIYLVSPMIQGLQARGDLISDALRALPPDADFDVERSILAALAKLQEHVVPTFRGAA